LSSKRNVQGSKRKWGYNNKLVKEAMKSQERRAGPWWKGKKRDQD